jgi:hypothetical protein
MAASRPLAHIPDIAWIIALYKFIHGGDPAPSDIVAAASVLAGSVAYASGQPGSSIAVGSLAERFEALGLKLEVSEVDAPEAGRAMEALSVGWQFVQLCWGIGAHRQCVLVQVPKLVAPPPQH